MLKKSQYNDRKNIKNSIIYKKIRFVLFKTEKDKL